MILISHCIKHNPNNCIYCPPRAPCLRRAATKSTKEEKSQDEIFGYVSCLSDYSMYHLYILWEERGKKETQERHDKTRRMLWSKHSGRHPEYGTHPQNDRKPVEHNFFIYRRSILQKTKSHVVLSLCFGRGNTPMTLQVRCMRANGRFIENVGYIKGNPRQVNDISPGVLVKNPAFPDEVFRLCSSRKNLESSTVEERIIE
jgi:hypothetical protein